MLAQVCFTTASTYALQVRLRSLRILKVASYPGRSPVLAGEARGRHVRPWEEATTWGAEANCYAGLHHAHTGLELGEDKQEGTEQARGEYRQRMR